MIFLPHLLAAALAAAPGSAALAPSSPWVVQSEAETCRVLRRFGGRSPVTLSFEQAAPRAPMAMMATGGGLHMPALRDRAAVTADFTGIPLAHFVADGAVSLASGQDVLIWRSVGFRPSGHIASAGGSRRSRGSGGGMVPIEVQEAQRAEAEGRERAVDGLAIKVGMGGNRVLLATGAMSGPMTSLRDCMDRQLRAWGLDPATERTIVAPPVARTRPDTWILFDGASRLSLRRGEIAPITVRLIVDERGKVADCRAAAARDGAAFETALCRNVTANALFMPARAAGGRPVKSYLLTTIRRSGGR